MQGGTQFSTLQKHQRLTTTNVLTNRIYLDPQTHHGGQNLSISFVNPSQTGFKSRWETQIEAKTYQQENQSKFEIFGKVTNPAPCTPQAGSWRSSMKNCEKLERKCASSSKWNSNDLLILLTSNLVFRFICCQKCLNYLFLLIAYLIN